MLDDSKDGDGQNTGDGDGEGEGGGVDKSTPSTSKMVKESDLMAVKSQNKEANEKVTNLTFDLSTSNDKVTKLEAEILGLTEKVTNAASSEDVEKLKSELAASTESRERLEKQLLDNRVNSLVTTHKIDKAKLEGKSSDQLDLLEEVLKGTSESSKGFDLSGGGGGTIRPEKPRDRILAALNAENNR